MSTFTAFICKVPCPGMLIQSANNNSSDSNKIIIIVKIT